MSNYTKTLAVSSSTYVSVYEVSNVNTDPKEFSFKFQKSGSEYALMYYTLKEYTHDGEWKVVSKPNSRQEMVMLLVCKDSNFTNAEEVYVNLVDRIDIRVAEHRPTSDNLLMHVPLNLMLQALILDRSHTFIYDVNINEAHLKISRYNSYIEVRSLPDEKIIFHLEVERGSKSILDLEPCSVEYNVLSKLVDTYRLKDSITNHSLLRAADKIYYPHGNGFNVIEITKLGLRYDRVIAKREVASEGDKIVLFDNPKQYNETTVFNATSLDKDFIDIFYEMHVAHNLVK